MWKNGIFLSNSYDNIALLYSIEEATYIQCWEAAMKKMGLNGNATPLCKGRMSVRAASQWRI